jgi:uncharacterized protein (TIGR03437 family)
LPNYSLLPRRIVRSVLFRGLSTGVLAICALSSLHASGTLVLSADGLTVADTANGITWLANANLPASNRFGLPLCTVGGAEPCVNASGAMSYQAAAAWVKAMNAANYLGHNDWQIPISPISDPTCSFIGPQNNSFGWGCSASAFGSLYNALGLAAPNSAVPPATITAAPFSNFQPALYWTQTSLTQPTGDVGCCATFSFNSGWQGSNITSNLLYALPMIPGKIPGTPAPSGTGLQINPGGQTVYDPVADVTWLANANLAAGNSFGLPVCKAPGNPNLCVNPAGAMNFNSATQFIKNMNAAAYLGQSNWELPPADPNCAAGYVCSIANAPLQHLYYSQLNLAPGTPVVTSPDIAVGPFSGIRPYLYWTCESDKIQNPCGSTPPAPGFQWSFWFDNGFQGTDVLAHDMYVTAYFPGTRTSTTGPEISFVANAEGESPAIAPNTWLEIKGVKLAPAGDTRVWQQSDFKGNTMPVQLDQVSATVNGKSAYVYFISPGQIDILTPPDPMTGPVQVVVNNAGTPTAAFTAQGQPTSPSFFVFAGGPYVAAVHLDGTLVGPTTLYPGASTPAKPGEIVMIYANGFGPTSIPVVSGAVTQGGVLTPLPVIQIGGVKANVLFAGLSSSPGEFQFNVVIPPTLGNGDQTITATYGGASTQVGGLITVQN